MVSRRRVRPPVQRASRRIPWRFLPQGSVVPVSVTGPRRSSAVVPASRCGRPLDERRMGGPSECRRTHVTQGPSAAAVPAGRNVDEEPVDLLGRLLVGRRAAFRVVDARASGSRRRAPSATGASGGTRRGRRCASIATKVNSAWVTLMVSRSPGAAPRLDLDPDRGPAHRDDLRVEADLVADYDRLQEGHALDRDGGAAPARASGRHVTGGEIPGP